MKADEDFPQSMIDLLGEVLIVRAMGMTADERNTLLSFTENDQWLSVACLLADTTAAHFPQDPGYQAFYNVATEQPCLDRDSRALVCSAAMGYMFADELSLEDAEVFLRPWFAAVGKDWSV